MNRKGQSFPPSFARTFSSKERRLGTRQNLLAIQMRVYLISMVDPWFPISMNKAKHHSKEKPLDEAKIAKLLDLFDNMLTGLREWSKRV